METLNLVKNFEFNDIVLYAKGWYERSEDIVADLGYLLSKIYAWTPTKEHDVALMMLRVLHQLYLELNLPRHAYAKWYASHFQYEEEIEHRMSLYGYSRDKAIITFVLCILQGLERTEIELNPPHYGKKEHFRMGCLFGKYPISMTYKEMNKRAQQVFKKKEE
jgi:hypothetical protein